MLERVLWISVAMEGVVSVGLSSSFENAKDSKGALSVASSSVTRASPIGRFDDNVASKGNSMCPGWSGLDQPRPGEFTSTAPAPLTSPTSTRSSPICRTAVLGQRARALAAVARMGSHS